MKPAGFSAVMAMRSATAEGDDLDYFPTPPWAARAGGEIIRRLDPDARTCWEPACGGGHMAYALADYFEGVFASDIVDRCGNVVGDFLLEDDGPPLFDWIVTNPPFNRAEDFIRAAVARARRGAAMLCRTNLLESVGRHALLFFDCPLALVAPFSERVPMVKGRWDPAASTATAYSWFFWLNAATPYPADWLPPARAMFAPLTAIPPGTRARLSKPEDVRRFAEMAAAPLFDEATS